MGQNNDELLLPSKPVCSFIFQARVFIKYYNLYLEDIIVVPQVMTSPSYTIA